MDNGVEWAPFGGLEWPGPKWCVLMLLGAGVTRYWLQDAASLLLIKISCGEKIYYLRRKIFLAEKNISCGKKYFLQKNIFLAEKNVFLAEKNMFLAEKNIFLAEKNISCGKKIFLAEKYISCGEKFISCGKKYVSCGEKYISCGKKYFVRKKNISCGKIFLYHVTNKLPYISGHIYVLRFSKVPGSIWWHTKKIYLWLRGTMGGYRDFWVCARQPTLRPCDPYMHQWYGSSLVQAQAWHWAGHLNQWWLFVYWTLRIKLKWRLNEKIKVVYNENAMENVICFK